MRANDNNTIQLGELVAAIFDEAAKVSTDPLEVSRLATKTVRDILEGTGRTSLFRHRCRQKLKWSVPRGAGHA
jgi:hypothetical protein